MATESKTPPPSLLGSGAAAKAAAAIRSRRDQLDDAEKKDTGYKAGGRVKAPSPAAIKAYSKEYDTIRPAGRNVHEGFAGGGMVRRGYGKARGA